MGNDLQRPYRLGLDLGSNSLGWFITWLEKDGDRWKPIGLGPGGVRIFPDGRDPQSGTSNAVDRRDARSARKRRDRFVDRRKQLMDALVRHGLMPAEVGSRKALEGLDPYELRARALEGALPAHHIGRALFQPQPSSTVQSWSTEFSGLLIEGQPQLTGNAHGDDVGPVPSSP